MRPRAARQAAVDPDAAAYIAAVEAADGQSLEAATKAAIAAFVVGCKSDGIWTAMKSAVLLCGARTLAGALTPLAGTAPTNYSFVSGDYLRATGLKGGYGKSLGTNRTPANDPQDSHHMAGMVSEFTTLSADDPYYLFASTNFLYTAPATGSSLLQFGTTGWNTRNHSATGRSVTGLASVSSAFVGHTRQSGTGWQVRRSGADYYPTAVASQSPSTAQILAFTAGSSYNFHRFTFYSIGEHLDLAKLEARVLTLIAAFSGLT
jgi:hypothetical protein